MHGAVHHVHDRRKIECATKLCRHAKSVGWRRRPVIAHDDVEGIGGDEVLREIGRGAGDASGDRCGNRRMRQVGRDELLEFGDELMHALGRNVQAKQLDRHEPILIGFVRAKNWSKRSGSNLMQDAKGTERVGKRRATGFRVQRETPNEEG